MHLSHSTRFSLFAILPTFFLAALLPVNSAAHATNNSFEYEKEKCAFELPLGATEGEDVECGFVEVPEEHANPDGPAIRLAVAIIRSQSPDKADEPLFMAQGGPGGSTIETYAQQLLTSRDFVTDRDIVLFDQRGTKYSQPNLACPEIDQLIADTIEKDISIEEDERLSLEAMQACRDNLSAKGVNLSAFDSLENAADINAIREALGYEKINLYGVSYGTLLALHTMRMNPEMLRSVILDGVVPTQTNFLLGSAKTMDQAFTRLFTTCREDPTCNKHYPDLEQILFEVVDQLNHEPALLELKDIEKDKVYPKSVIDGDTFMGGVFQMLYASSLIPALPRMIYDAKKGDFDFFRRIYAILLFDRSLSLGMYYSVICAEDADFLPADQDLAGIRQQIAQTASRDPQFTLDVCQIWDVQPLESSVDEPVQSEIPTLILSGGFDPITPAAYASQAASTLANSFEFIFPAGGHGQALESECQNGIIQSFLADPTTKPDESCIEKIAKPVFFTPRNVIDLPIVIKLLNIEGNSGSLLILLMAGLFILLSAVLVIPILWLVNRSHPPQPSSWISRAAGWIAFFNGPLLAIFLTGFTAILIQQVASNDNRILLGLPAVTRGWFILPLLFALLSLVMLLASLEAWIKSRWKVMTRLYYSGITIGALVSLVILTGWGLVTAIFQ